MSKIGFFLLCFGLFVAICVSCITTGASFNYAGPGNFFETADQVIASIFYQQVAINFVAFAILAAVWDGLRQLWPRLVATGADQPDRRTAHHRNLNYYLLVSGLGLGMLAGFYQVALHNNQNVFDTLAVFFAWLAFVSLPLSLAAIGREIFQRLQRIKKAAG